MCFQNIFSFDYSLQKQLDILLKFVKTLSVNVWRNIVEIDRFHTIFIFSKFISVNKSTSNQRLKNE